MRAGVASYSCRGGVNRISNVIDCFRLKLEKASNHGTEKRRVRSMSRAYCRLGKKKATADLLYLFGCERWITEKNISYLNLLHLVYTLQHHSHVCSPIPSHQTARSTSTGKITDDTMQRLTSTPHSFLRGIAGVSGLPRCLSTKAQTPKQPKARGDNEYVKRRLIYRYDLHDRRIAIKDELNEARTDDSAREEEQRRQRTAASQMREERKRYVRRRNQSPLFICL